MKLNTLLMCVILATANINVLADDAVLSKYSKTLPASNVISPPQAFQPIDNGKYRITACNNDSNMFIQIKIEGEGLKRRAIIEGLNLYIDITGKKKEKYYIQFPTIKPPKPNAMRFNRSKNYGTKENETIPAFNPKDEMAHVDEMAFEPISLFCNGEEYMLRENEAMIDYADNCIIYTCALPYSRFFEKINKKGKISVEFAIRQKASKESDGKFQDGMPEDGPGMPPPGGDGGMGMPPGGGGGGMPMRPFGTGTSKSDQYKSWITIILGQTSEK